MKPTIRRAVTLTDVVIVLSLLGLVLPPMVTAACRSREAANRIKCGSNLRQIGNAMRQYAFDNAGDFPRGRYDPEAPPTVYTGAEADNPFAADGPAVNDVTAGLYHLLRESDLVADVFFCPTDIVTKPGNQGKKRARANFAGRLELGFSFAIPYPSPEATADGFEWRDSLNSTFAVGSDMNPGPGALEVGLDSTSHEMRQGNSFNHDQEGQNVLYADGSVRFAQSPFAGPFDDNIWTSGWSGNVEPRSGTVGVRVDRDFYPAPDVLEALPVHAEDVAMMPLEDLPLRRAAEAALMWRHFWLHLALPVAGLTVGGGALFLLWRATRRTMSRSVRSSNAFG